MKTYDDAFEEVIADSCESFLRDAALSDKAEQLYKKSPETANAFVNFFRKIIDKIKYYYSSILPQSQEGRIVSEWKDSLNERLQLFIDGVNAAARNLSNKENSTNDGGVKNSIRQTQSMGYSDQLKKIEQGKLNGRHSLYVGIPSAQLQNVGFSDAPFAMNQSDYRKARRESGNNKHYSSHSVSYSFFKLMPEKISNTAMMIDNGVKVSLITDYLMKDTKGNDSYVIVGIWQNQAMDDDVVNQIKSVYPLDDFQARIKQAADEGRLIVINKNKAENMLNGIGVQPSEALNILNLTNNSLSQITDDVKQQPRTDADLFGDMAWLDQDDDGVEGFYIFRPSTLSSLRLLFAGFLFYFLY